MADRVTGDQTDNVVGRTSTYYATPTTNCCGCPEDVLVVLRFSCPSLSPLVVLCFLVLLFCFACHISGGLRHLLVNSISFHFILFSVVSLSLSFFSLSTHLDCLHLYSVPVDPVRQHVIALSTLLTTLVYVVSLCRGFVTTGRIGTDTGCAGCRRVERTA